VTVACDVWQATRLPVYLINKELCDHKLCTLHFCCHATNNCRHAMWGKNCTKLFF